MGGEICQKTREGDSRLQVMDIINQTSGHQVSPLSSEQERVGPF